MTGGQHSVACRYQYTLSRLGLEDTEDLRILFWDACNALEWPAGEDAYTTPINNHHECEQCEAASNEAQ